MKPKILAFAGSTRKDSYNKKLIRIAATAAERAGAATTLINLRDYALPLYDGDSEEAAGIPENAKRIKELLLAHQGLLISCPEYNSSITAVLKNTIDWASRPLGESSGLEGFRGQVVALMSASPGSLGGLRGLVHVRAILGNIGCIVLPDQVAIANAAEAFGESGRLVDPKQQSRVENLGVTLTRVVAKLHRDSPGT